MSDATGRYTLKHPVTLEYKQSGSDEPRTETLTEITINRPTGKDMYLLDEYAGEPLRLIMNMIARLSRLDLTVVEKFDAEDITGLGERVYQFLPD